LYVNPDRERTLSIIRRAEKGGVKVLCITVDAPFLGRRERDMRNKMRSQVSMVQDESNSEKGKVNKNKGVSAALTSFIDPGLCWADLPWFFANTKLPIVLKGVQCGEDAVLAAKAGCAGIIVSNHGGRQLDYARSAIEVLPEVMQHLKAAGLQDKLEVYMDGGVSRGTDIFKALALGARGVGVGRPTLYGLAAYGQAGVERMLDMLQDEFRIALALNGCKSIADIRPEMVITRNLSDHFVPNPSDFLHTQNYIPLSTAARL